MEKEVVKKLVLKLIEIEPNAASESELTYDINDKLTIIINAIDNTAYCYICYNNYGIGYFSDFDELEYIKIRNKVLYWYNIFTINTQNTIEDFINEHTNKTPEDELLND